MFEFKTNGFDKIQNKLEELQKIAEDLEGERSIPLYELFNSNFMHKYTSFKSFEAFLSAGNFKAETKEEFDAIPDNEMNKHVSKTTDFKDWENMFGVAVEEYVIKRFGF